MFAGSVLALSNRHRLASRQLRLGVVMVCKTHHRADYQDAGEQCCGGKDGADHCGGGLEFAVHLNRPKVVNVGAAVLIELCASTAASVL